MLSTCLDAGIKEIEFWEMTPAELMRAVESKNRVEKVKVQERATFDYILAELMVSGFSCVMSGKGTFPSIAEVYPSIFGEVVKAEEEKIQKQKDNLSTLRFLQFAQSYNERHKDKEVQQEQ